MIKEKDKIYSKMDALEIQLKELLEEILATKQFSNAAEFMEFNINGMNANISNKSNFMQKLENFKKKNVSFNNKVVIKITYFTISLEPL